MHSAYFYPAGDESAFLLDCMRVAAGSGFSIVDSPLRATVAIAPLLTRILRPNDLAAPVLGTLVFHPSALPYRRGPDAIRWALAAGERVSAATWFWADPGIDTGPICEQEVVVLAPGERPGVAYRSRFQPAALRALGRALRSVSTGTVRRLDQDPALATYESFYRRQEAPTP